MPGNRQKGYDSMFVEVCGLSDIGRRRELNEDSFRICGFEDGASKGVAVLADGMGGHNAGEIASSKAAELIATDLATSLDETDEKKISLNIAAAIDFANSEIYKMSLKNYEQAGMGTTVVVAFVREGHVRIANIGDSCAYVVSPRRIRKITVDHSVVEELVQSGTITREEARNHPDKNIITRAVGTEEYVDADFFDYAPVGDEVILLCSDGLTEMVRETAIRKIINSTENLHEAVSALIDAANEGGGVDNITVIALRFKKEEEV